jgi:hypothetical protein
LTQKYDHVCQEVEDLKAQLAEAFAAIESMRKNYEVGDKSSACGIQIEQHEKVGHSSHGDSVRTGGVPHVTNLQTPPPTCAVPPADPSPSLPIEVLIINLKFVKYFIFKDELLILTCLKFSHCHALLRKGQLIT